ncbi:ParA family protein [bacterium]|nr:MAG: ParA family protein [bacterium]
MAISSSRYAIWNNKGGVGKTFVSFVVATEYSRRHPEIKTVVIDMCPQANVSEILLGGNGSGSQQLEKLLATKPRKTVGGYFDQRVKSPHVRPRDPMSFVLDVAKINTQLPANMLLVAGDPSLEVQTQAMNQIAAQTLPPDAWANVHMWLIDLVESITDVFPKSVFFIDCNPSFSAYTEIALLAANRLIVPCTADGSSARAIDNLGRLLYGIGVPMYYKSANFALLARKHKLALPKIHAVPLNRSTQYDKKASKAFAAMYKEIKSRVTELQKKKPGSFSHSNLFIEIPDAHAVSVVASHEGRPLANVSPGSYDIHGVPAQLNKEPLERYKDAVGRLVESL